MKSTDPSKSKGTRTLVTQDSNLCPYGLIIFADSECVSTESHDFLLKQK